MVARRRFEHQPTVGGDFGRPRCEPRPDIGHVRFGRNETDALVCGVETSAHQRGIVPPPALEPARNRYGKNVRHRQAKIRISEGKSKFIRAYLNGSRRGSRCTPKTARNDNCAGSLHWPRFVSPPLIKNLNKKFARNRESMYFCAVKKITVSSFTNLT